MEHSSSRIVEVSLPGAPPDLLDNATQRLLIELNRAVGPIATRKSQSAKPGAKGDIVSLGQIVLALISAGVTKQIADILIQYVKRNPKYCIQVGNIKITKEHASKDEIALINSLVRELDAKNDK